MHLFNCPSSAGLTRGSIPINTELDLPQGHFARLRGNDETI